MRRIVGLLGLILFVAGCATTPSSPPVDDPVATWHSRQAELKPITTWKIRGRVAMRSANEGWQASMNWERESDRHRVDLTGPLGRGHLRLVQDKRGAELRDADNHIRRAKNAEQLLYRATGWLMPLNGMYYWVLGLPVPGPAANHELDGQGRLSKLVQSGWEIQYLEYSRYGSLDLPSKIFIKRQSDGKKINDPNNSLLELRLAIESWALDKPVSKP